MCALRSLIKLDFAGRRFTSQHVELMTKRQDLYLQRRSRPEQSDQRQPNQAANISHQPRALPDSTLLASRIEFPTMTGRPECAGRPARSRWCKSITMKE